MYWEYKEFDKHMSELCTSYRPFAFSWVFSAFAFFPYYVTIGMIAVSLYRKEKYLKLVGLFLTVDFLFNTALYYATADLDAPSDCGDEGRGTTPSSAVEQSIVFAVMMTGLLSMWKRDPPGVFKPFLISAASVLSVFSRMLLGLNTPEQVMFGALVGFAEGWFFLFVTYSMLWPRFHEIDDWYICRKYLKLEQTMCEDAYP